MNRDELRKKQAPLKKNYLNDPDAAKETLHAEGTLGDSQACLVKTDLGTLEAGLHPLAGGDGSQVCSGEMLLQALVGCAGVTLNTVATAMEIELGEETTVRAEAPLDFRGTLGVSREASVGFDKVRLIFELKTDAEPQTIDKLIELTERYCVVYQTLKQSPEIERKITT